MGFERMAKCVRQALGEELGADLEELLSHPATRTLVMRHYESVPKPLRPSYESVGRRIDAARAHPEEGDESPLMRSMLHIVHNLRTPVAQHSSHPGIRELAEVCAFVGERQERLWSVIRVMCRCIEAEPSLEAVVRFAVARTVSEYSAHGIRFVPHGA